MEVFTIQSYGKNRFEFILKELVDPKKGLLSFTAPESKQKYLLTCRDRTAERCFDSNQNRELVPRQNFLTKNFKAREINVLMSLPLEPTKRPYKSMVFFDTHLCG
jgi:hypothetical protein